MEQSPTGPRLGERMKEKDNQSNDKKKSSKRRMPSPIDLVSHYEKQGLETQEASLKVIADLQGALFRMITAKRNRDGKSPENVTSAKLDAIHSRLVQLEMKVDSKPSYPQALALGVASAGIWNGVVQLWGTVRQATSSSPSSS